MLSVCFTLPVSISISLTRPVDVADSSVTAMVRLSGESAKYGYIPFWARTTVCTIGSSCAWTVEIGLQQTHMPTLTTEAWMRPHFLLMIILVIVTLHAW